MQSYTFESTKYEVNNAATCYIAHFTFFKNIFVSFYIRNPGIKYNFRRNYRSQLYFCLFLYFSLFILLT